MSDEMASRRGGISAAGPTAVTAAEAAPASGVRRVAAWALHELYEILPPVIFFFVGFNLIVLTTNLILADYSAAVGNFMLATTGALVVGKACWLPMRCPFCAATTVRHCSSRFSTRQRSIGPLCSLLGCSKLSSSS